MHDVTSNRWDLYDLDIGEADGASVTGSSEARTRLETALARLGEERQISPATPDIEVPTRTLEALRALGYAD